MDKIFLKIQCSGEEPGAYFTSLAWWYLQCCWLSGSFGLQLKLIWHRLQRLWTIVALRWRQLTWARGCKQPWTTNWRVSQASRRWQSTSWTRPTAWHIHSPPSPTWSSTERPIPTSTASTSKVSTVPCSGLTPATLQLLLPFAGVTNTFSCTWNRL